MRKKLSLRKETIRTLSQGGMSGVYGGGVTPKLAPGMDAPNVSGFDTQDLQNMGRNDLTPAITLSLAGTAFLCGPVSIIVSAALDCLGQEAPRG